LSYFRTLLCKIRDCFPRITSGVAMTNPRLEVFSVIARSFFATKQSGFGHRCNYNGLLAILDSTDFRSLFIGIFRRRRICSKRPGRFLTRRRSMGFHRAMSVRRRYNLAPSDKQIRRRVEVKMGSRQFGPTEGTFPLRKLSGKVPSFSFTSWSFWWPS
jgi:hypothetical protein